MPSIDAFLRRMLLTPEGRRTIAIVYSLCGVATVITYWVERDAVYALVQGAIIAFGLWWARWCLRRPA